METRTPSTLSLFKQEVLIRLRTSLCTFCESAGPEKSWVGWWCGWTQASCAELSTAACARN